MKIKTTDRSDKRRSTIIIVNERTFCTTIFIYFYRENKLIYRDWYAEYAKSAFSSSIETLFNRIIPSVIVHYLEII